MSLHLYTGYMTTRRDATFPSRFRYARSERRKELGLPVITLEQIANHFGIAVPSVSAWGKEAEPGKKESWPEKERYQELADILQVNPSWLYFGMGLPEQSGNGNIHMNIVGGRKVPRIKPIDAAKDFAAAVVTSTDYIETVSYVGRRSFWTSPPDESCSPDYQPVDDCLIDPDVIPSPGDLCFAGVGHPRRPVMGRLAINRTGSELTRSLRPINSMWPEQPLTADDLLVGPVIRHHRAVKKT